MLNLDYCFNINPAGFGLKTADLPPTDNLKPLRGEGTTRLPGAQTGALGKAIRGVSFNERRSLLMGGDVLILAFMLAAGAWLFDLGRRPDTMLPFGALIVALHVAALWLMDLYDQSSYPASPGERFWEVAAGHFQAVASKLARAVGLATMVTAVLVLWRLNWFPVQPKLLPVFAVGAFGALWAWRLSFFALFQRAIGAKRVLVLGAGRTGQGVVELCRRYPHLGYEVVGFVDDDPELAWELRQRVRVLGRSADLGPLMEAQDCDALILAVTGPKRPETLRLVADSLAAGVELLTVPDLYERHFGIVPLHAITESWFVYNLTEVHRSLYVNLKRMLDAVGAAAALVLLAPLLALVALAVKLDSPGPVLYSQIRVGRGGKPFRIYKFRSMRQDAEANGAQWAQKADPRVTRWGRLMRKTRLDELPQLWNVLKGELAIVGPRPERPEFVAELKERIPYYDRRHIIQPGLTGWAQVRFAYAASVDDAFGKLQYDFFYIKNRSLMLDLEIILRTIWVVLARKGAQ